MTPKSIPANPRRWLWVLPFAVLASACDSAPTPYHRESAVQIATPRKQVWAVAPVINLSGQRAVDGINQADLMYRQLQEIKGLIVVPVDRVVTVYAALGIQRVESADQAALICEQLGADALVVGTITQWEPYPPPKIGASLQVFAKPQSFTRAADVDPRVLVRQMAPSSNATLPDGAQSGFYQASGMFDASAGSVRESVYAYAVGRTDPKGPWGSEQILADSDKYAGFVYRRLTEDILNQMFQPVLTPEQQRAATQPAAKTKNLEGGPAGPQPFPSNRR